MDIVGISEKEQVSLCKQLLNVNFVFLQFYIDGELLPLSISTGSNFQGGCCNSSYWKHRVY